MTPFILWFLGLLFVLLEFYLPGAILGTIGGVLLIISVVLFAVQSTSAWAIVLFVVGVIASTILLILRTLKRIPNAAAPFSIYLKGDQEGYQAAHYDAAMIGKKGVVIADLKPGGYILVEGKKMAAISQTGYLPSGSNVVVIGGEGDSLIVRGETK